MPPHTTHPAHSLLAVSLRLNRRSEAKSCVSRNLLESRMLSNTITDEDIQRLCAPQEGYMFSIIRKFSIGATGATVAGQNLYMSPTQGLLLFTAVKTRKSMTKNQRKACRHGTVKEETAKKLLKAKFVQDGWYLRGVHQDETVTRITDEHCGMTKNASACGVHACGFTLTVELSSGRSEARLRDQGSILVCCIQRCTIPVGCGRRHSWRYRTNMETISNAIRGSGGHGRVAG